MQKSKNGYLRRPYKELRKKRNESKGKKERYTHLNAHFPIIARRDKKAFLSEYEDLEEYIRMGKTRNLFKKIRDT